mgnify:CR=1 FL=1
MPKAAPAPARFRAIVEIAGTPKAAPTAVAPAQQSLQLEAGSTTLPPAVTASPADILADLAASRADLQQAVFLKSDLSGADFYEAKLDLAGFEKVTAVGTQIIRARLKGVQLLKGDWQKARLNPRPGSLNCPALDWSRGRAKDIALL